MATPSLIDQGKFSRHLEDVPVLPDVDEIPIVDADTHITEPADLWTSRVSTKKWGDLVPHVKWVENRGTGSAAVANDPGLSWFVGDEKIAPAPSGVNAGWKFPPPSKPPTYEEAIPASYTLEDRLQLMNDEGVYSQVLYPNVAGFGAERFGRMKEEELKLELVKAYNDFIHEWTAPAAHRFVKVCAIPFWDLDESIKEIHRNKDRGFTAVLFGGHPQVYGLPHLPSKHWDRFYSVCEELDLSVNTHIGGGDVGDVFVGAPEAGRANYSIGVALLFLSNVRPIAELCMGGVFARHPKLRVVSVESGIGWVPFLMEAMDHQFFENKVYEVRDDFDRLPSEYLREHIYTCFWFERIAPQKLLHDIGVDHVLFETDFPHPTSLYPAESVRAHAARALADATPEERRKVMAENAARLYKVELPVDQSWRS